MANAYHKKNYEDKAEIKVGTEEEEEKKKKEEEKPEDLIWEGADEKKMRVSYVCDECDYRWEDIVIRKKGAIKGESPCPLCGSMNVIIIEYS